MAAWIARAEIQRLARKARRTPGPFWNAINASRKSWRYGAGVPIAQALAAFVAAARAPHEGGFIPPALRPGRSAALR